ncbi:IS5 family transposase [Magnetospira sp. QH-2]|uniref:IS5 family transposase n=1 Tax=Magnetospira sp. (strain QH-2) TaxID=1288970 RepID=UPI0011DDDC97|nr:IS5 family transposase [Magnetospira sp. QH-2]
MQSHHFWLSDKQFERLQPLLPNKTRGVPRVDDRRVISGIIHVLRHGLMWRDAPVAYGPHKTLYNRFVRWSEAGVFDRIFATLAAESTATHTVMIDATHLKAHRTAASAQKGAVPRRIGRTKGGLNSKLHAACDADGKPLILLLTEGQVSDYRGADTMLPAFPDADDLIADRGYDSDRFRQALLDLGIEPCIPGRSNRKEEILYDKALYKQRNLIERMFGRLKDWRRIATRYDRCAHTFMSAICIAATVIFWL